MQYEFCTLRSIIKLYCWYRPFKELVVLKVDCNHLNMYDIGFNFTDVCH